MTKYSGLDDPNYQRVIAQIKKWLPDKTEARKGEIPPALSLSCLLADVNELLELSTLEKGSYNPVITPGKYVSNIPRLGRMPPFFIILRDG